MTNPTGNPTLEELATGHADAEETVRQWENEVTTARAALDALHAEVATSDHKPGGLSDVRSKAQKRGEAADLKAQVEAAEESLAQARAYAAHLDAEIVVQQAKLALSRDVNEATGGTLPDLLTLAQIDAALNKMQADLADVFAPMLELFDAHNNAVGRLGQRLNTAKQTLGPRSDYTVTRENGTDYAVTVEGSPVQRVEANSRAATASRVALRAAFERVNADAVQAARRKAAQVRAEAERIHADRMEALETASRLRVGNESQRGA
ncbi:hypothetical protein [Zhihengliuella halotolerans]|uniref:hypothetical protein n=1 Tax=Zhihengliuella halotolerans TaxID=370736 RepID=UPI000C810159|nr:hypothetical protein [Zhihengliuella halotolerans]